MFPFLPEPNLPVLQFRTIQQHLGSFLSRETLVSRLAVSLALLAVLLAAIGLYGVMSFNMARRVHEIGIRMPPWEQALARCNGWSCVSHSRCLQ